MRVRITRRLANVIDGIDLSNHEVGDVVDLPEPKARLLIAEGWGTQDLRGTGSASGLVLAFRRMTDPGHTRDEEDADYRAS